MADKVEFKTVKEETVELKGNNFLEIARKIAVTDEGENEFISLSKGFFAQDNSKRFSRGKNVSVPADKDTVKKIIKAIEAMVKEK